MGYGTWNSSQWNNYKTSNNISNKSTVRDLFKQTKMKDDLNPKGIKFRESCDSNDNPNATPVILGLDVTGSMGYLSEEIAKDGLNKLITEIYDKKPVSDPHVMIMAIGDAYSDSCPLQVSQFEADIRIAEQLQNIYFEGRGGGNDGESYLASWYFAARHTKIDCLDKHNKKGYLFTIGDEPNHDVLTKSQIKDIFGDDVTEDITAKQLLNEVSRMYEVFHIIVGNYSHYDSDKRWQKVLGERALILSDHTKIPETIESTLAVLAGKSVDDAASQWDGSTSVVVKDAIKGLTNVNTNGTVVTF